MQTTFSTARVIPGSFVFAVLLGLGCGSSDPSSGRAMNHAGASDGGSLSVAGLGSVTGGGTNNASGGAAQAGFGVAAGSSNASAGSSGNAAAGASGAFTSNDCNRAGLVWRSANKTNYTSYPDPGSEECIQFSGCEYEGLFAACDRKRPLEWVKTHDIVAAFPDLETLELHDLCLKSGNQTIVVTVYDTCADSDCDGCCTQNKGTKDELIDIESFTDARWGVPDGAIQWADLGPTKGSGCE